MTDIRDTTPLLEPARSAPDSARPPVAGAALDLLPTGGRPWRAVPHRILRQPVTVASLAVFILLALVAFGGGRLWRYHYADITAEFSTPPSAAHPFGTDSIGHDELAQVLRGAQKSLAVGLVAAAVSTALGAAVGAVAGFYRGRVDAILMRLTDAVLTVPGIAILVVLAGRFRNSSGNWLAIALIVAALSWTGLARIVRGMMLSLRERPFVEAARAAGAGDGRIVFRHLLPHAVGPIIVKATFGVGAAIFAETGLSYLGLGISPPDTSLGSLVAAGQSAVTTRPWLFYFPGLFIVLIVLSVNLIGDGLRDALEPSGPLRTLHAPAQRRRGNPIGRSGRRKHGGGGRPASTSEPAG